MDTLESMKRQLRPTGLYRLDGTTAVELELAVYADALDAVRGELLELQAESFVATASGYGLRLRERASGLSPEGETADRRAALLGFGAVRRDSATRSALEAVFASLGFDAELEEDAAGQKITVKFRSMPKCGETEARKKLEIFLPAHLEAKADFTGVS